MKQELLTKVCNFPRDPSMSQLEAIGEQYVAKIHICLDYESCDEEIARVNMHWYFMADKQTGKKDLALELCTHTIDSAGYYSTINNGRTHENIYVLNFLDGFEWQNPTEFPKRLHAFWKEGLYEPVYKAFGILGEDESIRGIEKGNDKIQFIKTFSDNYRRKNSSETPRMLGRRDIIDGLLTDENTKKIGYPQGKFSK